MDKFQSIMFFKLMSILLALATPTSVAASRYMSMRLFRAELVRIAGYGEEKLSSVMVIGTLLCDACSALGSDLRTSHVSGAKVGVVCEGEGRTGKMHWTRGITDEYGDFMVELPSHIHAIPRLEDACKVTVLSMPKDSLCQNMAAVKPRDIQLSSVSDGVRVYSSGTIKLSHGTRSIHECSTARAENSA